MKNKLHYIILSFLFLYLVSACSGDNADEGLTAEQVQATEEGRNGDKYLAAFIDATATPTLIPTPIGGIIKYDPETAVFDAWHLNTDGRTSLFSGADGLPLPYDVLAIAEEDLEITDNERNRGIRPTVEVMETPTPSSTITVPLTDGTEEEEEEEEELTEDFVLITTSGIPDYKVIMTDSILEQLSARPLASIDFREGSAPRVARYSELQFGQDIGYATGDCASGAQGFGYWPPSSDCPQQSLQTYAIPRTPYERAGNACPTSITPVGFWVNGVAISNWWDGNFYSILDSSTTGTSGKWHTVAPFTESFDLDVCGGKVFEGLYSHNSYPVCLAHDLGDNGAQHSPILGFAVDGYPIYGPWEDNGVLAESCWLTRNYEDAGSQTGCEVDGRRTCLLNNPYDASQGTTITPFIGPSTDALLTTESGAPVSAASGLFLEDYYYSPSCTEQGAQYLDEYNGHYDEIRGYHYHVTIDKSEDGTITPVFPFTVGPSYAGAIYDNSDQICYLPDENTTFFQIEFDASIDLGPIAAQLGVSVEDLRNALINSGGNLAVAAASLGIGEAALSAALTGGGYVVGAIRSIDLQAAGAAIGVNAQELKQAAQDIQEAGQTLAEAAAILGITPENLGLALKAGGYAFNELRQVDIILVATNIRAGADDLAAAVVDIQSGVSDVATAAAQLGISPEELTAAMGEYDIDLTDIDFDATAMQTSLASTLDSVDLSNISNPLDGVNLSAPAAALGLSATELQNSIVVGADGVVDYVQTADVLGVSSEAVETAFNGVDLSGVDLSGVSDAVNLDNVDLSEIDPGFSIQNPIVIDEE